MTEELAVSYRANDGTDVALDASTVRKFILTGSGTATDADVAGFLALCQARGLNPLARDAYLVKYGDGPASTIVSKDFYVRAATQQPTYKGMRAGVVVINREGELVEREGALVGGQTEKLVGGWAEVHDDRWAEPMKAVVAMSEYDSGKSLWRSKPATMIRKVAVCQCLREAYGSVFGGLYDASEMGFKEDAAPVAVEIVETE